MFRRLNSLFLHTEIIELKQRDTNPTSFDQPSHTGEGQWVELAHLKPNCIAIFSNRLKRLTEHWYGPMKLSGGKNARWEQHFVESQQINWLTSKNLGSCSRMQR